MDMIVVVSSYLAKSSNKTISDGYKNDNRHFCPYIGKSQNVCVWDES